MTKDKLYKIAERIGQALIIAGVIIAVATNVYGAFVDYKCHVYMAKYHEAADVQTDVLMHYWCEVPFS